MERAVEFMVAGRYGEALGPLDEATKVCPTNHKAWGNRGSCLVHLGRHQEALASLERALSANPGYALAWENMGHLLCDTGKEDRALECFLRAISMDPSLVLSKLRAGRIFIDRKKLDSAIALFDQVLASEPKNTVALSKRALALHEKGDKKTAFEAYMAAMEANPLDAETINNFGTLFEEIGNPDGAANLYGMALKANPNYRPARQNLARVQSQGGPMPAGPTPTAKPPAKPPQQPKTRDSGDAIIDEAERLGLLVDRDIGFIPEAMPMFERASVAFHRLVVDAMRMAAASRDPQQGLAVMQRSCMYLFGKGVQAVMVWGLTSDGKFGLDFQPGEMIQMKLGPSPELSPEANQAAAGTMKFGIPLFAAHQAFMQEVIPTMPHADEAFVQSEMLKTLQWVPKIAISYGLKKGYHKGSPAA
ncbi:MAG: tetratricopeptide repeat protein [Anaeromyxobacter sp.]|nr:tetratricopeptide repeat protein [Anaeromyxobacter sp.]